MGKYKVERTEIYLFYTFYLFFIFSFFFLALLALSDFFFFLFFCLSLLIYRQTYRTQENPYLVGHCFRGISLPKQKNQTQKRRSESRSNFQLPARLTPGDCTLEVNIWNQCIQSLETYGRTGLPDLQQLKETPV